MLGPARVHRFRIVAPLLGASVAGVAGGQTAKSAGAEFDMRTSIVVSGGMSGMLGGLGPGYTGHGYVAGKRMRVDIVEGSLPPFADKGDYILFDSTGMIAVRPAKKEFSIIPSDAASKVFEQMEGLGVTITVADVSVTLDSVPGIDTVAGYPTRHYRTNVSYTMSLAGMGVSQQVKSRATTDYWVAATTGLVTSPLERTGGLSGGSQSLGAMSSSGPLKGLVTKVDSITRLLRGTPLRTKATTSSDAGVSLETTAELSNLRNAQVDESLLVVPTDFAKAATPGIPRDGER